MSLFVTSLNSGSNGNCYYIGNDNDAVLIDAGISRRETEKRMTRLGLSMKNVRAIFISHEHSDHIRGLTVLAEAYRLPVYVTARTMKGCYLHNLSSAISFDAFVPVSVHSLSVTAFPKFHDAADPHSFTVSYNGVTVGVFTDIGKPCINLTSHFSKCHAAFLEANYDDEMLEGGRYPIFLKNRIRGGNGHLSNREAFEVFTKYRSPGLTHLFLSHLSKDNNCPELVSRLFNTRAANTNIIVASRYVETPVYAIHNNLPAQTLRTPLTQLKVFQASLF